MKSSLPADLLELKNQFETWRKTRQTRAPIPEELRQAAVALLERYSAALICRVCRLHPHSLKKPVAPKPAAASARSTPAFFSLAPLAASPLAAPAQQATTNCRLQLERPDGARLILTLPAPDCTTLASLCADFLRA
jgi:hypothetical protein